MSFPLYYTLNQNVIDKKLSDSRQKKMADKLIESEDLNLKKAVIMLIAEHAKIKEEMDMVSIFDTNNPILPYDMIQKSDDVIIKFDKLPNELQQILWKFIKTRL
ncbi:MAG TPA: hypothetical protein PKD85_15675 [Saprospiraceae bacterium]|nr:hypothetical protein [Saprospiraceae bacterium]